jgi:cobalamin biosynthesis protein CobD/CbiB
MIEPLMLAGVISLIAATTALWAQGRAMIHQRIFAGLISLAVTVVLFSLIAWATAAVMAFAPVLPTWVFVGAFALVFARRLYRELRTLPEVD